MSGVSVYHMNYLYPNDLWLFLHPHYKDFTGRSTTITTIKIGYDLPINVSLACISSTFVASHVPIYLSVHT